MIKRLRRFPYLTRGMLVLLVLGWLFAFSSSPQTAAITMPSNVRIGMDDGDSFVDLKPAQGSYRLIDKASGKVLDSSLSSGEIYRVQIKSDCSGLQLFRCKSVGSNSWEDKGTYKGPIVMEETTPAPSRGAADRVGLVEKDGRKYRGSLEVGINRAGNGLVSINQLGLEEYLCGVLPREVSDNWPLETLKAQAVAARTYALRNLGRHTDEGFNLCGSTNCQAYGGYSWEGSNCTRAVNETRGMVLVDNKGALASTLYHSNSGGYLEDNINVNGYDIYYLKAKPDPYSLKHGLANWGLETVVEGRDAAGRPGLKDSLLASGVSIGRVESLELVKYPSGRVQKVMITDDRGNTIEKTGSQFGTMFNPGFSKTGTDQFMSRLFDITTDATVNMLNSRGEVVTRHGGGSKLAVMGGNGQTRTVGNRSNTLQVQGADGRNAINLYPQKITVEGHGWGHGVGMSQWGAYEMGLQGFKYDQILSFYYSGTKLVNLNK